MDSKTLYLPGLNGLRAIAALAVVICHTMNQLDKLKFSSLQAWSYSNARYAVTLFFVLSGFLITYLLLQEKKKVGVDIRKFYIRRILRIWPLYYFYILTCFIFMVLFNEFQKLTSSEIYWFLFFSGNISFVFGKTIEILGHYWSINLEEQFYLLWPIVIRMKQKYIFLFVLAVIFIFILIKFSYYFSIGKQSLVYIFLYVNRFHCMLIGSLGSILYFKKSFLLKFLTTIITQLLAWAVFVIISFELIHIPSVITDELFSIIVLIIIIGQVTVKKRVFNLDNRIFNFFGKISYGIYIIHPLVIVVVSALVKKIPLNSIIECSIMYSLVIFFTTGLAYLSYQYIEKPFLAMKDKFTVIKSTNNKIMYS